MLFKEILEEAKKENIDISSGIIFNDDILERFRKYFQAMEMKIRYIDSIPKLTEEDVNIFKNLSWSYNYFDEEKFSYFPSLAILIEIIYKKYHGKGDFKTVKHKILNFSEIFEELEVLLENKEKFNRYEVEKILNGVLENKLNQFFILEFLIYFDEKKITILKEVLKLVKESQKQSFEEKIEILEKIIT